MRIVRIAAAAVLVLVAAVTLLGGLSESTTTATLPPTPGTDVLDTRLVPSAPGITAALVAALVLAATIVWLVRQVRAPQRGRWWFLIAGLVAVAFALVFAVGHLPSPHY